jgi:ferritin-like metal-binding protein YciE
MAIKTMHDLFVDELRDIYSAERQAVRAYSRLRKTIKTESLAKAVETHQEETKEQVERLSEIFEKLELKTRGKTCHAMQGLIEEAQEHAEAGLPPELLEVALVAELQKMEHYEIAAYGSAVAHAQALGLQQVVGLLQQTLEEEKKTDTLLNELALNEINPQAAKS